MENKKLYAKCGLCLMVGIVCCQISCHTNIDKEDFTDLGQGVANLASVLSSGSTTVTSLSVAPASAEVSYLPSDSTKVFYAFINEHLADFDKLHVKALQEQNPPTTTTAFI